MAETTKAHGHKFQKAFLLKAVGKCHNHKLAKPKTSVARSRPTAQKTSWVTIIALSAWQIRKKNQQKH
jgi:hypothetical protein